MKFVIAAACAAMWSSVALAQASAQNDAQKTAQDAGNDDVQQTAQNTAPVGKPTISARPSSTPGTPAATVPPPPTNNYDQLGVKGWATPFPLASDSLIGDAGGLRTKLADNGLYFLGYSLNGFAYDLRGNNTPGANYNGRRPTYYFGSTGIAMTYDASRIGLEGGQFEFQLNALTNAANDLNGPKNVDIGSLTYFQPFLHDTFEVKVGYMVLANEFMGANVAGSFANGSLGPSAAFIGVVGAAFPGLNTPGITIKYNAPNHFYDKVAIVRAIPNEAVQTIVDSERFGMRLSYPGTKALVMNEFGYNRPSAPDQHNLWFRAGGVYNWTQYTRFDTGGTSSNRGAYAAIDYQLTQPDPGMPFRGIYAGASFTYAPPNMNLFSRYFEARVYGLGIIPGRPLDMASLVFTDNSLSRSALNTEFRGLDTANNLASITASYAYHILPGAFVQVGLGVVKNAEIYPKVNWALESYLSVNLIF
ncbi:carbohydrate porin [Paraburkholderia sp. J67]|uniref:carbohydrate porin n=1 Tax=Paraburkholderia sp. J67 TaxID=2805435 RepID=UPI002ABDBB66|nr:carbohydrate porin [Paraburkholderia sp. J67]